MARKPGRLTWRRRIGWIEMDNDIWGESAECDSCGEIAPCIFLPDPFMSEVFPEDGPYPEKFWCEKCYENRQDEV
jgi:hypothetical protein